MNSGLLTYALNEKGKMIFIDDVPNGLACHCRCPHCLEPLIAKNDGEIREHHFAHVSGSDCSGAYETAFHLLAKEIISKERAVMVPEYRHMTREDMDEDECLEFEIIPSELMQFEDVEVEERNDASDIQPDCVGVTKDGLRVHIEIFVTHKVDKVKKRKIRSYGVNCVEIQVPRNISLDRNRITEFLLNDNSNRKWINYPYADRLIDARKDEMDKQDIIDFRNKHPECKAIFVEKCDKCDEFERQVVESAEEAKKTYNAFIAFYQNRIHRWAVPILKLSPHTILNLHIGISYTYKNRIPFVWYNNQRNYIYPLDDKGKSHDYMQRCDFTYGLFKKLYGICQEYVNATECYDSCSYNKACYVYQRQVYVFCSNPKLHHYGE